MCWIGTTVQSAGAFGNTGNFYVMNPAADIIEIPIPDSVNATDSRTSFATYNGDAKSRCYMVGGWTDNLVLTEHYTLTKQGIPAPINPIVNAAGTGMIVGCVASTGPGVTGNCIVYFRWWDDLNARRSPLSDGSPTFALANQARSWSNLPTEPNDDTVTHIEGWVSMDGGFPRFAWRRDLGTTTVVENVATALLADAETESLTRFPRGRFNVMWNDRQVIAGDDRHPDRLYLSPTSDPENYGGFYLRTRKGEQIVGLISMRKQLIVLSATSSYIVEGYTEDDITMDILEPEIGTISHFAIAQADGWAILPAHRGIYLLTGSTFHPISHEFNLTWRWQYKQHRTAYENSWAVNDIETNSYKLFVGTNDMLSLPFGDNVHSYWVLDYTKLLPNAGGDFQQPALSIDARLRKDECAAILKVPGGRGGSLFTGSSDGIIREENVVEDTDDDGDFLLKEMLWRTGHVFPNGPGGSEEDGALHVQGWAFVRSEDSEYSIAIYNGDESAIEMDDLEAKSLTIPAGAAVDADGDAMVAKCVDLFEIKRHGRGLAWEFGISNCATAILADGSDSVRFSGFGWTASTGKNDRRKQFIPEPQS